MRIYREKVAREKILARGLRVTPFGKGWRITGRGVDLLAAELAILNDNDLKPAEIHSHRKE